MKGLYVTVLVSLLSIGCQSKVGFKSIPTKAPVETSCTVSQVPEGALITCPDGSAQLVTPEVQIVEVPIEVPVPGPTVYVEVLVPGDCPGNSGTPKIDPQPEHGRDSDHGHGRGA